MNISSNSVYLNSSGVKITLTSDDIINTDTKGYILQSDGTVVKMIYKLNYSGSYLVVFAIPNDVDNITTCSSCGNNLLLGSLLRNSSGTHHCDIMNNIINTLGTETDESVMRRNIYYCTCNTILKFR